MHTTHSQSVQQFQVRRSKSEPTHPLGIAHVLDQVQLQNWDVNLTIAILSKCGHTFVHGYLGHCRLQEAARPNRIPHLDNHHKLVLGDGWRVLSDEIRQTIPLTRGLIREPIFQ